MNKAAATALTFARKFPGKDGIGMRQIRRLTFCFLLIFTPIAIVAQGDEPNPATRNSDVDSTTPLSLPLPDAPGSKSPLDDQAAAGQTSSNGTQNQSSQTSTQAEAGANIGGSVLDTNGDTVAGATVVLKSAKSEDQTAVANEYGAFQFSGLQPGIPYLVTITVPDFETWKSEPIVLTQGQFYFVVDIKLKVSATATSVTVSASNDQIATEQVELAEKQRIFGIIPNFYVTYDTHPVPLTTKLKYKLALKADTDPITFFGVFFMATIYQAGDIPNYGQGWDAYFQRVGAGYADTTTDIFIGGAILPSLLHQDPRYFYQGTGTKKSRLIHAMSSPYVCKGDNGKTQINISSMGGDLASGAISNLYYPESDKGAGLLFQGFAITTGVRTVNAILQEFVIRKLTPSARKRN